MTYQKLGIDWRWSGPRERVELPDVEKVWFTKLPFQAE